MPGDIVINEVYFGKTKELLEIERLIGVMRDKYGIKSIDEKDNRSKFVFKGDRKYSNSSPEMIKINRLFEKAFGFDSFALIIIHTELTNAMTMPVSVCIDAPESTHKLQASLTGFKKAGGDKTFVCIMDGIFFNEKLTPAEVLGVILHEVGHNFQTSISPVCRGFSYIDRIIRVIMIPVSIMEIVQSDRKGKVGDLISMGVALPTMFNVARKRIIDGYQTLIKDQPEVMESIEATNLVITSITGPIALFKDIKNIVKRLATGLIPPVLFFKTLAAHIGDIALSGIDERGEIIADKFAAAYGYGAECQTALHKCRKMGFGMPSQEFIRKIPILNLYYDLISVPNQILGHIIDCHPTQIYRTKATLDFMKNELSKEDIDPKMKKQIESQIVKLEKNVKDLTDVTEKGFFFTNVWSAVMLTLFNGDPKAVLFGIGTNRDFDAAFENNLEIVKRAQAGKK